MRSSAFGGVLYALAASQRPLKVLPALHSVPGGASCASLALPRHLCMLWNLHPRNLHPSEMASAEPRELHLHDGLAIQTSHAWQRAAPKGPLPVVRGTTCSHSAAACPLCSLWVCRLRT